MHQVLSTSICFNDDITEIHCYRMQLHKKREASPLYRRALLRYNTAVFDRGSVLVLHLARPANEINCSQALLRNARVLFCPLCCLIIHPINGSPYIPVLKKSVTCQNNILADLHPYNEDTQPVIRAIGVSHTACKDEFRQNIRSHSWSVF